MSEYKLFKFGVDMRDSVWGVHIDLKEGEKVIIDSAEVVGTVVGVAADVLNEKPIYKVKYPPGSVYVDGVGYDCYASWFDQHQLRKLSTGAYIG